MSDTTVVSRGGPGNRWWLAVLLVVIILAILAIAYFVTHPHVFGATATQTPTATATLAPTSTPMPGPTGTPAPGPTGTPATGPTATPAPGPTGTPAPGPTATPGGAAAGVTTGQIHHPAAVLDTVQRGANQNNPAYTYYLNPFMVVRRNLPNYGFTAGQFTIASSPNPPAPTPTPFSNSIGLPQVKIVVKYQGKPYAIFLDQPVQQGPKGIWAIITIQACTTTTSSPNSC
jgi:hypothetical protein